MTSVLACRLLESKALSRSEVAAALRESCARGVSLVQALVQRIPEVSAILEYEFLRWSGPRQSVLAPDLELISQLPLGMCQRLLALPLVRSERDEAVPLAVVDPFDVHAMGEFRYCLGRAVRPVRVGYEVFMRVTDELNQRESPAEQVLLDVGDENTPAFGARALSALTKTLSPGATRQKRGEPRRGFTLPPLESPREPSEAPIPLVRTTLAPQAVPNQTSVTLSGLLSADSEPVLKLVHQKPLRKSHSIPAPAHPPVNVSESPNLILSRLEEAESAAQLLELLRESLSSVAPCQAQFSLHREHYVLRHSSSCLTDDVVTLTDEQQALLDTACQVGYCLGPLPPDGKLCGLGQVLGMRAREEIYVASVSIRERVVVVLVVGRFDDAFAITRWVDAVVERAEQILERLLRAKRQT